MLRAGFVAFAASMTALRQCVRLTALLALVATPSGLALFAAPAAALTVEIRDRADTLILDVRPPERRVRISAIDPATLEASTISEGSFLMVPVGVTLAANGDLLISGNPVGPGGQERIRPVDAGTSVRGFNLRHFHSLDVFLLAGGPSQSGGVFTVYLSDGTTALFLDGRFLTDPPPASRQFPRPTLVSEIDNGATLLIPLDSGWAAGSVFVVEDLFDLSENDRASITPGVLLPATAAPDDLGALPSRLPLPR
jgi:hypothetical protein